MSDSVYNDFIKHHAAYEAKNLNALLKEYKKIFANILFDNITAENAEAIVFLNIDKESLEKVLYKIHLTTGLAYGRYVAKKLREDNPIEKKTWKPLPFFSEAFQKYIINYYAGNAGTLITSLSKTIAQSVAGQIVASANENETTQQMRDRIHKTVNDPKFYKWQAMRIARTETSFAMNKAKELAADTSGVKFNKEWIGKNDGRERPSHIALNGTTIDQDEMFNVGGVMMKFPGDRENGTAEECINCRCTFGYVAKRSANGRLVFDD